METLSQDQPPPPKAVNIIRPSSPGFHYLKQRTSPALNQYSYHSYQHSTLSKVSDDSQAPSSLGSTSSTTSSSSSPSTLSTLSSGSGYNTNGNRLPPPTILNSSSFGFGFFQSQQNSTTSPTTWFKSPTQASQQQQQKPIPTTIDTTTPTPPLTTPALSPTTPKPTSTVKTIPSSAFITPFSSRFFRVPQQQQQQPYAADIHLEDSSGDEHSHFGPQDDDDYCDSIDGDTESENSDDDDDSDMDDLNDTMTDYDDESQEDDDDDQLPIKIVARIKHGTIIMNGKGEFVNKGAGGDDDRASYSSWLDEARASRKIADLEIEKTSLLALNSALESKVAQQTARIEKLEKQLHTNEWPLSPVSDKDMDECTPCFETFETLASTEILTEDEIANDHVFQRLRSMILGMIEHAEEAVRLKTKSTGRVLTLYNGQDGKNVITLDSPPTPPMKSLKKQTLRQRSLPSTATTTTAQQQKRPLRRSSDVTQDSRRRQPSTSSTGPTRKRTSMQRSSSRASSPATLVTTATTKDASPPIPPRPASAPMQRSSTTTTKPRPSHLRKSQDLESPKWHY